MRVNPFPGAASKVHEKKKKTKVLKRGGIRCTCGSLQDFFSDLYYLHDDDCIVNTKRKKK